MNSCRIWW